MPQELILAKSDSLFFHHQSFPQGRRMIPLSQVEVTPGRGGVFLGLPSLTAMPRDCRAPHLKLVYSYRRLMQTKKLLITGLNSP